jgi:hypothetical protein
LHFRGQFTDFVKKEGAFFRELKAAEPTCIAPVKAPFSCPNNSEAISEVGIAAQLTLTKAREARRDLLWTARAINSLPVPVSPVRSTVESVGATLDTRESTVRRAEEVPTTSSNMETRSTSSRSARFSLYSWSLYS